MRRPLPPPLPSLASTHAGASRRLSSGTAALLPALFVLLLGSAHLALTQEISIKVLVNDDPISDYDIEQRERFLAITTQRQPSPELKKEATDLIIDERLQIQQGRKLSVTVSEEDVTSVLDGMASKNNLDVAGLTTALGKAGVNIKTLRDRIRAQLVWQDVVRRKFRHQVQVGDVDVDQALSEAGGSADDGGGASETVQQIRQIKFSLPSGADQRAIAARLATAEAVRARFSSCGSIAELTKNVEGASIKSLAEAASLAQPARLLVAHAKSGQMTPPTLSASGVELYAVCGKRVVRDNKVREDTQRKLLNEEMMLRAERLLRDVRQEAFIEYR
jgi:peptidyl-prolyl cis-trans isomerase SurA